MPNFKSLQSLLGVPSSFEDEEELYSKMPTKEEELEAYTSTPKWSAEQYKQSITPEHREELERQQKARERTEEFEKPLEEDVGPLGALGYHVLKNIAFDERPPSEFEKSGGGVYESTSPIDFITPGGVYATGKGIAGLLGKKAIPKVAVSEVLPATKFQKIRQALPESVIEAEARPVTPSHLAAEERLALPAPAVTREGEEAAASALAKESPKYMVPGPWQESGYKRVTEELPIEFLEKYKGNALGKTDIEALKKSIQEEGLREPLILSFDPNTKRIKLGEGNHRLEALKQLGYTHAPVRASRSYVEDPTFPQVSIKPSTDRIDPSYYPADMKPSDVIDLTKEAETPAIVSSKPVARAKKSAVSQEPEPDRFIIPGMFLKTEQLIRQKMGKSASPQQIMGVLREAKPEELEYLRIPEFLEGQDKVTKEALLEHIKKNSPNLEEIPTKTLGFNLEEKTLLEQEESLLKEANSLFAQSLHSTRSLLEQLKKYGYDTNDALDIIDNLKNGSTEALQTLKNISPSLEEAAASYLDIELQHSLIQEELGRVRRKLITVSTEDFPHEAKYYKLPREQTLTLEHPKSEETYKERLYSISKPRTETRGDNIQVTPEGAKIYDEYQPEIEKAKRELEQYERSIEIPTKEIQEKINKATEYNREIDETLKKEFIKYYDNKYPERVGTPMDGRSTFNIAHGSSFNYLSEVDTIEKKIAFIRGMHLPLDKHFIDSFIQNISSNKQYIDNLKTIKDGVKSLIDYTNKLFEYKESLGDLQNASYNALKQHGRGFQGPHWDEPNVFAHTRSTEFTAPNGQRHLFAQELQSDWHQKIRDQIKKIQKAEKQLEILESKGQGPKYDFRDFSLVRGGSNSYSETENYINYLKKELKEIPKAPMNRTWHEFLAKRLLKDAAEGDFDNISWTTGDTQNERYNLEKFFSKITYNPETKDFVVFDLNGEVVTNRKASPEVLPDYIGEELSEKLLSTEPFGHQGHFLSGEGLKTGGEGMRGFYDEIIPSTMAKFGKKYGVKPEKVMMPDVGEIWTMKLTPEMKEYIKKYGFPMFMLPGFMQQEEVPEEKKEFKNINKLVKDKK